MSICMEFEFGYMELFIFLWKLCVELVKFYMEKYLFSYTSMKTTCVWKSSFGLESIDTWFGTLYFVYESGLETLKLISC